MKPDVDLTRLETLLYYVAKLIGLAPFTIRRKKLRPVTLLYQAYAIVVSALFIMYIFWISYDRVSLTDYTTLHQLIILSWSLAAMIVVASGMFTFAIKGEKIVDLLNRMIDIHGQLGNVKIETWCHGQIENNIIAIVIKTNSVVLLLQTLHEFSLFIEYTKHWNPVFTIGSALFIIYTHNIILIFVETLVCFRQHFDYLNKNMQRILRQNFELPFPSNNLLSRGIFVVGRRRENHGQGVRNNINEVVDIEYAVKCIKKIEILHEELIHLAKLTARIFTVPIVFIIYEHFFILILLFYQVYKRVLLPSDASKDLGMAIQIGVRVMSHLAIIIYDLVLVTNVCASTCRAANTMRSVLITLWNKFQPTQLKSEFVMFSFQLLHEPLIIHVFGFYSLGYSCIYQIISAVITYALLVIQFEPTL